MPECVLCVGEHRIGEGCVGRIVTALVSAQAPSFNETRRDAHKTEPMESVVAIVTRHSLEKSGNDECRQVSRGTMIRKCSAVKHR